MLGAHVVAAFSRDHSTVGVDRNEWWGGNGYHLLQGDLNEPEFLAHAVEVSDPDALIHCAAIVAVDECERDPQLARSVNVGLTARVCQAVREDCRIVFVSTDAVFDGSHAPSKESDTVCPVNIYGRTKRDGEIVVFNSDRSHLVVRTNFYGWSSGRKKTSGEWMYAALRDDAPVTFFDDFFFTPLYVADLAMSLQGVVEAGQTGTLHLCGRDRVSKHEFGMLLAAAMGVTAENVRKGSVADVPLLAARSTDLSLTSEHPEALDLALDRSCRTGIGHFVRDHGTALKRRFQRPSATRY